MTVGPKAALVVLVASLALVGCSATSAPPTGEGSSEPTESAAAGPSAEPATGEKVTGDGYSFTAPEGWGLPEDAPETVADTFVIDLADTDGFADNVNVVPSPVGAVTPEQVESVGIDELESAGATDVSFGDRLTVAGSESANLSAAFTSGGVEYRIEQYFVTRDAQTFVVTFSFSPSVAEEDRDRVALSVLATWEWV